MNAAGFINQQQMQSVSGIMLHLPGKHVENPVPDN
jgi:hypothetical protein